jgi:hypothetical protein
MISSKMLISGENACWMMLAKMGIALVAWLSLCWRDYGAACDSGLA